MISITINVSEICLCSWLNIFWGPCVWPGYCLLLYRLFYVDQLAFLHCTALLCQGWVKDKWFRARWLFSKSSIHNILNQWNSSVSYMYCALEHCTAFNFILQFTQISNAPIVTQNIHLQAHRRADARANLLVIKKMYSRSYTSTRIDLVQSFFTKFCSSVTLFPRNSYKILTLSHVSNFWQHFMKYFSFKSAS